tara:strand:+ start:12 stop:530 length:519 start_codon:yes stop_codon:yes gene_type:complete
VKTILKNMELNDAIISQLMMPGSTSPAYDDELEIAKKALELNEQGIKARFSVEGSEQSDYGKVLDGGTLYYEDPKLPGKHVEVDIVEGYVQAPRVKEGSLDHRVALETHLMATGRWNESAHGGQGLYMTGYPKVDNPGSDAARFYEKLEKSKPLEEKYLGQVKALLQKGYRF